ncbi:hypothetical protein [Microlunatus speluncae]|uniref:hypothetical protein n=1 Tax=Microlunatus speluncae TaxID=2594267 RepID=UPI0012666D0C|nr:hypothetical protein [Microlunatus speluncae]
MGTLDPYDAAAGLARVDSFLSDLAPGAGDASAAEVSWAGSVIVAELRVAPAVAQRNGAEQAALHQAWSSEMITVLTDPRIRRIETMGDRLWAIYATRTDADVAAVFDLAGRANALRWVINTALHRHGQEPIDAGLGVEYGQLTRAAAVGEAGGNLTFIGEPIARAEQLAERAGHGSPAPIWYGSDFAGHLDDHRRQLLTEPVDWGDGGRVYTGNVVDQQTFAWIEEQAGARSADDPTES